MNNNLLAGGTSSTIDGSISNPLLKGSILEKVNLGGSSGPSVFLNVYLPKFVELLLIFGSLSFFFMLIWGAISWILSGGDKASLEGAKNKITNAIIGMVLMIGSFAIIKLIESFFGIKILSIDIGPLVIQ